MTETEFRVKHSTLIEYYQLIEERFKYICSTLMSKEEHEWFINLNDVKSDPFGMLLNKIKSLQEQKKIILLTKEDFENLNKLRNTRNYWVHQCFGGFGSSIIFKRGNLKNPEQGKKISTDLLEAIEWEKKLVDINKSAKKEI